jgi:PHP family Zn ribbon phosphoesterase
MFYADLHVHSRYSRATSRAGTLENFSRWGRLKGIKVVATGDFTHPAWRAEIGGCLQRGGHALFEDGPVFATGGNLHDL